MKQLFSILIILTLVLSACSTPGASLSSSGVEAWLDQPPSGAILPLGTFTLKAHARHAAGSGITRIEFLVNGVPVGAVVTDPSAPLAYAEAAWNASAPGEYKVMARAYAGGEVADSAPAIVCVSSEAQVPVLSYVPGCQLPPTSAKPQQEVTATFPPKVTETLLPKITDTPKPTDTPWPTKTPYYPPTNTPWPTNTPYYPPTNTPWPTNTPYYPPTNTPVPPDTTPPVVDITNVTPKELYYGEGCSYNHILSVDAYVYDAGTGLHRVFLVYGYVGVGTEGIRVAMSPMGGGYFHAEVNIGNEANTFLHGSNGSVAVSVVADDLAGNEGSDYYGEVPVLYCPG